MPSQVHSQLDYTRVLGGRGISTLHGAQGSLILDSPSVDREAKLEAEGEGMWWMGMNSVAHTYQSQNPTSLLSLVWCGPGKEGWMWFQWQQSCFLAVWY